MVAYIDDKQPRTLEVFHYLDVLPDLQKIYRPLVPEKQNKPGSLTVEKTTHMHLPTDPTPDVPYVRFLHPVIATGWVLIPTVYFVAKSRAFGPGLHTDDSPRAPSEVWYHRRD